MGMRDTWSQQALLRSPPVPGSLAPQRQSWPGQRRCPLLASVGAPVAQQTVTSKARSHGSLPKGPTLRGSGLGPEGKQRQRLGDSITPLPSGYP